MVNIFDLQLGILIPAGMPLPPNVSTSKDVKSGLRNLSFSNSLPHGNKFRKCSAFDTKFVNLPDISLFTAATKPSNSPLTPAGSLQVTERQLQRSDL